MTALEKVLVSDPAKGIRVITINHPEALNAIDVAMTERLVSLLDQAASDSALRCLIITGTGERAFSAGFDIREMNTFDASQMREAFVGRDALFLRIAQHPLPVIAALNGLAYGAGALIAAAADFRVAGSASSFKVTAINYGSANATWSLPRIIGPARAKDILMTGREVGSDEGLRIGLFDRLALGKSVVDEALMLAEEIAAKPPAAVAAAKVLINGGLELSLAESWANEHRHVLAALDGAQQAGADMFALHKRFPTGNQ